MAQLATISSGLLLPGNISDVGFGEFFFRLLHDVLPGALPSRYGKSEPLKNRFKYESLRETLVQCWGKHFLWVGCEGKIKGIWSIAPQANISRHSTLFIYGKTNGFDWVPLLEIYKSLSCEHEIDFGYIHFISDHEHEYLFSTRYNSYENYNSGVVTHSLRKGLPDLGWITLFGRPYIDLVGVELLLQSPVYKAEIWPSGIVCMQLTPEFPQTAESYKEFQNIRQEAMGHIGSCYFASSGESSIAPVFFRN